MVGREFMRVLIEGIFLENDMLIEDRLAVMILHAKIIFANFVQKFQR